MFIGDCTRLTRVFSNFLSNSIKNSPTGSVVSFVATVIGVEPMSDETVMQSKSVQQEAAQDNGNSSATLGGASHSSSHKGQSQIQQIPSVLKKRLIVRVDVIDEGFGMEQKYGNPSFVFDTRTI